MQTNLALRKPEIATANHDATNTSTTKMVKMPKIRQSMPDLGALSPVSGMATQKMTIRVRPVWNAYSTTHAKFMAPREHQPIIPTENAGSSNKLAGQVPQTGRRGLKAMTTTRSPDHQTKEDKEISPANPNGERYKHNPRGCPRITE